jgi:hypothetical protein
MQPLLGTVGTCSYNNVVSGRPASDSNRRGAGGAGQRQHARPYVSAGCIRNTIDNRAILTVLRLGYGHIKALLRLYQGQVKSTIVLFEHY